MNVQKTISEIESNAKRLLEDAKLLQTNDRHQSASSIAVLAIEEAAKTCLLLWNKEGYLNSPLKAKELLSHANKQRILVTFVFVDALMQEIINYLDDDENIKKLLENNKDKKINIVRQFVKPGNEIHFENVLKNAYGKFGNLSIFVESGALDWFKQSGFYTDINEQLEIQKPPNEFSIKSSNESDEFIELAELGISMIHKHEVVHRAMAAVYQTKTTKKFPSFKEVVKKY